MSRWPAETEDEFEDDAPRARPFALRALWVLCWGLVSFVCHFVQAVAEEVAPLLLLLGALWWGALKVVAALPIKENYGDLLAYLPQQLALAGRVLTPGGLIGWAIGLLAVVAACRTIEGIIARRT